MTTSDVGTSSQSMRRLLRRSGAVLWILVAVAAVLMIRQRANRQEPTAAPTSDAISEKELASEAGNEHDPFTEETATTENGKTSPTTAGGWDADGIDDFEFFDVEGNPVTKYDLLGKPWVVSFIFTSCAGTCPAISRSMNELQDKLADVDMRFVSITVDPEFDTAERLQKYGAIYGANPERWLFLTGDQIDIYRLIQKSFKMPVKEILGPERQLGYEVLHSNYIMHVDATGRVVGKYDGTNDTDMVALRRTLQNQDAASGDDNSDSAPIENEDADDDSQSSSSPSSKAITPSSSNAKDNTEAP